MTNVVTFPRKWMAHAVGGGFAWATKIQRPRLYFGRDAISDDLERLDAELAVNEAEYHAMELAVAEAAALEPQMTPRQVDCAAKH
jgi:hypothetical protein